MSCLSLYFCISFFSQRTFCPPPTVLATSPPLHSSPRPSTYIHTLFCKPRCVDLQWQAKSPTLMWHLICVGLKDPFYSYNPHCECSLFLSPDFNINDFFQILNTFKIIVLSIVNKNNTDVKNVSLSLHTKLQITSINCLTKWSVNKSIFITEMRNSPI